MTAVSSSSITPSIRFLHTYPESSCKFLTHPTHSGQEGFSLTFYLLPCGLLIPLPFTLHFALYAAGCTISDFFNMTPEYFCPCCLILTKHCLQLTQYHQVLTSAALYWPSTITYQPVPPLLTQYHQLQTSAAPYWPSTTKCQPVPPYSDSVPSCINHYRPILTQYHQVPTCTVPYWPSTIMYQTVPPSTSRLPCCVF